MHLRHQSCLPTALSIFLGISTSLAAQIATPDYRIPPHGSSNFSTPLSGQLLASASSGFHLMRVLLLDPASHRIVAESSPNSFGSFELPPVPNGLYDLQVVNIHAALLHSRAISLPYASAVEIRLDPANSSSGTGQPVSLARMQHKIPNKAQKEFNAAQRAVNKRSQQQAIEHFEKALAIDPLYFEALNDLGVIFVRLRQFEQAFQLFTRATAIDPSDSLAERNLALTLLALHRFPEAEQAARASLRSDPLSARAHFYLALSLLEQNKANKEAIFHLTKAADEFEPAKKLLEQMERAQQIAGPFPILN